jgi:ketosteroid isomerase-like protein
LHPNERILRRALAALAAGDTGAVAEVIADDVVVHFPGASALAGDHRGRGALGALVRALTGNGLEVEAHDVLASDGHAVGIYRMRARRDGRPVEWRHVNVYHIRDGKIVEVWQHPFDQAVVEACFSRQPV